MSIGTLNIENLNAGQRVAVKYFAVAMVLFLAQCVFGLLAGLQFLKPDGPARLKIPVAPTIPGEARLRIGLLGPEGDESLSAQFNGHELPVSAKILQEIPLDPSSIRPTNQLEIHLDRAADDSRLAVGFASIVVEEERDVPR